MIVANTAKNMLAKKHPLLFSDLAVDDEGEAFEYQIEDDDLEVQPELSYTRQETKELVHELIDSLSEEQRLCILMFHIEGIPISEIARAMECSENTVKSRLNYGRKNLRMKAGRRDTNCTVWLRFLCSLCFFEAKKKRWRQKGFCQQQEDLWQIRFLHPYPPEKVCCQRQRRSLRQ